MSNLKEFGGSPFIPIAIGWGRAFGRRFLVKKREELQQRPQSLTVASLKRLFVKLVNYKFLSGFQFSISKAQLQNSNQLHLNFVTFRSINS
jgi:hypothetical protein